MVYDLNCVMANFLGETCDTFSMVKKGVINIHFYDK